MLAASDTIVSAALRYQHFSEVIRHVFCVTFVGVTLKIALQLSCGTYASVSELVQRIGQLFALLIRDVRSS